MSATAGRRGHAAPTRPRACDVSRDGSLTILNGSVFMTSTENGDVTGGVTGGFFHQDVRHLSRWELLVGGKPAQALTSSCVGS